MDGLRRVAARQGGLFTRAQARAAGLSAYQVRRRLAVGQWQRVAGQVLASRDLPISIALRDRAYALAVPGAVLAGASAARQFGLDVPDPRGYLWIGSRRQPALPGVRWLRDPLCHRDVMLADGVPVTNLARAVTDCLRFLDHDAAVRLLDRALQAAWILPTDVVAAARANVGRWGAPQLARLARLANSGARSEAERVALALLRRAGIDGWLANQPIYDAAGLIGIGDLVFPAAKLVVEIDGWAYHRDREQFERDRRRQNRLITSGWTVLRFTWADITRRPRAVVETITAVLARARL